MLRALYEYFAGNEAALIALVGAVKVLFAFAIAAGAVPFLVLAERKLIGYIQQRPGPNRVGPWGILQAFVDGLKLFFKEDLAPRGVERVLFYMAPSITLFVAFVTLCAVPIGPEIELFGFKTRLAVSHLDTSLLFVFAVGSLGVYGIILGGWASNNKYSLLGALRSAAQMVSYELPLALAVVGVLMMTETFSLSAISEAQGDGFWHWFVWRQPIGFVLFVVAGIAEVNRLPFDLAEGESELTAGFHTEYSSMKFAFFFMAEYINMLIFSVMAATLFLGGWAAPLPMLGAEGFLGFEMRETLGGDLFAVWVIANALVWTGLKVAAFIFFFILLRGTLPRLRYDQLMSLGWKVMIPAAFVNLGLTALVMVIVLDPITQAWSMAIAGFGLILVADLVVTARRRRLRYDIRVS